MRLVHKFASTSMFYCLVLFVFYHFFMQRLYPASTKPTLETFDNIVTKSTTVIEPLVATKRSHARHSPTYVDLVEEQYHNGTGLNNYQVVLNQFGYRQARNAREADLVMTFYPPHNKLITLFSTLSLSQKINLFPGMERIVCKFTLTKNNFPFVPKSFLMPSQLASLNRYLEANPNSSFLVKDRGHHNVSLLEYDRKALEQMQKNTIVQLYLDRPFLLYKHRFDIGIFTLVTSVNPLRVYMYDHEMFLRLCSDRYHPFDPQVREKYIAQMDAEFPEGDLLSTAEEELGRVYKDHNYSSKAMFQNYLAKSGHDPDVIWSSIRSILSTIFVQNQEHMKKEVRKYTVKSKSLWSFYEINRADFIIDETAKVYLLEVNRRPHLGHWLVENKKVKSQKVINDSFLLIGLNKPGVVKSTVDVEKEIALFSPDYCTSQECFQDNCFKTQCIFCLNCLTEKDISFLASSFYENTHLGGYSRILPRPVASQSEASRRKAELLSANGEARLSNDLKQELWYIERCLRDVDWCI